MRTSSSTQCYILHNGATQEETCTWEDLRERVESGELAPDTLIYREESQRWVTIASLDEFEDVAWDNAAGSGESEEAEVHENLSELREEYERAVRAARDRYDSIECVTEAARLALSLDKQDEAFDHYQRALELQPFNKRLATEIKRSFSPVIYRSFTLLDRQPFFWEDPLSAIGYPSQVHVIPFLIATAALTILSLLPYAQPLYWIALTLLVVRVACEAGQKSVPSPDSIITDLRSFCSNWKPFACFILCCAAFLSPFALVSELLLLSERAGHWNFFIYIQNSPLMTVAIFVAGAALLPAALMVSTNKRQELLDVFALKRIMRIVASDDWEYLLLIVGITAIALAWLGLRVLFSFIPVIGDIVAAAGALYGVLVIGYITGRTRSRHEHLF